MTPPETLCTGKDSGPVFQSAEIGARKHIQGVCRLYAGNPFALFAMDPFALSGEGRMSIFRRAGEIDVPIDDPFCIVTSEHTFRSPQLEQKYGAHFEFTLP